MDIKIELTPEQMAELNKECERQTIERNSWRLHSSI